MVEKTSTTFDNSALASALAEREQLLGESLAREQALLEQSFSDQAERTQAWEQTITDLKLSAQGDQLASYQSMANSLAGLLGGSIRDQAKVMVPFEIAEATREFARFLGTHDPTALAASLKHALAARQYAAAAKAGHPGGGESGGGGAGSGAGLKPAAQLKEEEKRHARVVVNVGRRIGVVDTYEFARTLIDAINENLSDDVVLEVSP